MKKIAYIVGGIVAFIVVLSVILGIMAEQHDGPTQSCAFRNSSNETRSITFEYLNEKGEKVRRLDLVLKPGEEKIERLPAHKYVVEVWDAKDNLVYDIEEYNLTLPNNESNATLKYLDLEKDIKYALVTLNFVYEGNSFAESMSTAAGTNQDDMYLKKTYDGNQLFTIDSQYDRQTVVDFYNKEKLPAKIGSREYIYGLIPVPADKQGKTDFSAYIQAEVEKAMK